MSALGRIEKSKAAYKKALKLYPGCLEAVTGLARRLESIDDVDGAIATLERYILCYENHGAAGYKPGVVRARAELASILMVHRKYDLAREQIRKALMADPHNSLALNEAEQLEAAIREDDPQDSDEAVEPGLHRRGGGGLSAVTTGRALDFDEYEDPADVQDRPELIEFTDI